MTIGWLLRHLLAILVLPFTAAVLVPVWIARRYVMTLALGSSLPRIALQAGGLALLVGGLILFAATLRLFATTGRGTLAPWDSPRRLVVQGPYWYVRNPMISGVLLVLLGESALLLSVPHLIWTLIFFAINAVYIPLIEEPVLKARFGAEYDEYCRQVPRLLPRLRR